MNILKTEYKDDVFNKIGESLRSVGFSLIRDTSRSYEYIINSGKASICISHDSFEYRIYYEIYYDSNTVASAYYDKEDFNINFFVEDFVKAYNGCCLLFYSSEENLPLEISKAETILYVSSKQGERFGVTDTKDGLEEFYTAEQLTEVCSACDLIIYGFNRYVGDLDVFKTDCFHYQFNTFIINGKECCGWVAYRLPNVSKFRSNKEYLGYPVLSYKFGGYEGTSIDISGVDFSSVVNLTRSFQLCSNLKTITLSAFNTDGLLNIDFMFEGCKNLEFADLSSLNVSNVVTLDCIFSKCDNLQVLDITEWNTSRVVKTVAIKSFFTAPPIKLIKIGSNTTIFRKEGEISCQFNYLLVPDDFKLPSGYEIEYTIKIKKGTDLFKVLSKLRLSSKGTECVIGYKEVD